MIQLKTKNYLPWALLLAFLAGGCAGHRQRLDSSLEAAHRAVSEAKRNEANTYAPNELARAEQKIVLAEEALRRDHHTKARRFAEQATIDARYAETRAQAERAHDAATENRDTANTLHGHR